MLPLTTWVMPIRWVVYDIGKIICGQTVPLQKHLVVQGGVLHGNVPEDLVVEGGVALMGYELTDDIGLSLSAARRSDSSRPMLRCKPSPGRSPRCPPRLRSSRQKQR